MTQNDGGPAFPCDEETPTGFSGITNTNYYTGMSLRDWFAGQAINGIVSAPEWNDITAAKNAYQIADAMLEARKGKP